jgi:hypothetical protein
MIDLESSMDDESLRKALDLAGRQMLDAAPVILDAVGAETVAFLRSLTSEMQPPAKPGEPARAAHPGGWADITGQLANAYAWDVSTDGDGVRLVLSNNMEYAAALDAKDGYFVLSGVTEPGGPVEAALRRVVAMVAPDWEVRYG